MRILLKDSRNKLPHVASSDRPGLLTTSDKAICLLECLRFDCMGILQRNPVAENGFLIHVYLIAVQDEICHPL
jgi:hypothetical protein